MSVDAFRRASLVLGFFRLRGRPERGKVGVGRRYVLFDRPRFKLRSRSTCPVDCRSFAAVAWCLPARGMRRSRSSARARRRVLLRSGDAQRVQVVTFFVRLFQLSESSFVFEILSKVTCCTAAAAAAAVLCALSLGVQLCSILYYIRSYMRVAVCCGLWVLCGTIVCCRAQRATFYRWLFFVRNARRRGAFLVLLCSWCFFSRLAAHNDGGTDRRQLQQAATYYFSFFFRSSPPFPLFFVTSPPERNPDVALPFGGMHLRAYWSC